MAVGRKGASPGEIAPLIDLLPELGSRLSEEERRGALRTRVLIRAARDGPFDLELTLRTAEAFALFIVEGTMLWSLRHGEHPALRLLGPGDMISRSGGGSRPARITRSQFVAHGLVRYATLDDRLLALARRYPRMIEGLQMINDDQQQRLLAQLLICQLPRVEDRVLALMVLLAERWGRTGTEGTLLPIRLTHSDIGALVGARRSTVTLALKELGRRNQLERRKDDWLILKCTPEEVGRAEEGALRDIHHSASRTAITTH
jgi:CRP-like cAMP-binding protein